MSRANQNTKSYEKTNRIGWCLENLLRDPEFDFEVVEPRNKTVFDLIAKMKTNQFSGDKEISNPHMLHEALKYESAFNWSLIPLKSRSKVPALSWKQYSAERATDRQLCEWWSKNPDANLAVVSGEISDLIVIDIDDVSAFSFLENHGIDLRDVVTAVAKTQRGKHYFFTYHPDVKQKNFRGGEVRTDNHTVVIPPSIHPTGAAYSWERSPFEVGIADIPIELIEFTSKSESAELAATDNSVIPKGQRNTTLTRLAGAMRRLEADYEAMLAGITAMNKRCDPPLTTKEIASIAESVSRYPAGNSNGRSDTTEHRISWECLTIEDIYAKRPPIKFILEDIFVEPSLNMIYGRPGDLKSMLGQYIAACIANDSDCFPPPPGTAGRALRTKQAPIIWLDADMGRRRVLNRFEAIGKAINLSKSAPISIYSMPTPWPDFSNLNHAELLRKYIEDHGAKFIVIDNLSNVKGDVDENSAQMGAVLSNLRRVMEKTESTICIIHHPNKSGKARLGDKLRGHSSIEAALDLALLVGRKPNSQIVTVKPTKARDAATEALNLEFFYEHKSGTCELEKAGFRRLPMDHEIENVIKGEIIEIVKANPDINQTKLRKQTTASTGQSDNKIRQILSELEKTDLEKKGGPNNSILYNLKDAC